jgi:hypothetical protein
VGPAAEQLEVVGRYQDEAHGDQRQDPEGPLQGDRDADRGRRGNGDDREHDEHRRGDLRP